MIYDYTVIYTVNGGTRRELYLKAKSRSQAFYAAQELISSGCEIQRVYHDPDFP